MSSCSPRLMPPKAVNTISSISFFDLRLERDEYEIMNTITAEATVEYEYTRKSIEISGRDPSNPNSLFSLKYKKDPKTNRYDLESFMGVMRFGYLDNDEINDGNIVYYPDIVARRLAIYRIINLAKEMGADGIIEPLISTNYEQTKPFFSFNGKIVYKTTITGKPIRIKTNN